MVKHCPYEILIRWEVDNFPSGSIVCHQGKTYGNFFIILAGNAEIYHMAENGRKYSQAFKKAGDCFGDFEAFEQKPYICYVEAFTNLKVLQIRRDIFQKWLELDRNFNVYLTKALCNRYYEFAAKAGEDTLYSLKARLCNHLLSYCQHTTRKNANIEIKLNKDELSDRFAVTPRSVNRILQQLKDQNIITIRETSIVVNDLEHLENEVENSRFE